MKGAAITGRQIKQVHVLKNCLGLDDPTYRTVLREGFRVDSSKQLNTVQADLLIRDLELKAVAAGVFEQRPGRRKKFEDLSGRGGMATPAQLRKIEAMWQDVSRASDPEQRRKALRSFVERVAKSSDLRFLDQDGAGKVINALKKMSQPKKNENRGESHG